MAESFLDLDRREDLPLDLEVFVVSSTRLSRSLVGLCRDLERDRPFLLWRCVVDDDFASHILSLNRSLSSALFLDLTRAADRDRLLSFSRAARADEAFPLLFARAAEIDLPLESSFAPLFCLPLEKGGGPGGGGRTAKS